VGATFWSAIFCSALCKALQQEESGWLSGDGCTKSEKLAAKCVLLVGFGVFTNGIGMVIIFSAD